MRMCSEQFCLVEAVCALVRAILSSMLHPVEDILVIVLEVAWLMSCC